MLALARDQKPQRAHVQLHPSPSLTATDLYSPFLRTPSTHARSKMAPVLKAYHASAPPALDLEVGTQFVARSLLEFSHPRPFLAPSTRRNPSPVSSLLAPKALLIHSPLRWASYASPVASSHCSSAVIFESSPSVERWAGGRRQTTSAGLELRPTGTREVPTSRKIKYAMPTNIFPRQKNTTSVL